MASAVTMFVSVSLIPPVSLSNSHNLSHYFCLSYPPSLPLYRILYLYTLLLIYSDLSILSVSAPPPPLSLQGAKLMIYQKEFTIADCDTATKELLEEYGKPFGDPLAFPDNLYDPRIINM